MHSRPCWCDGMFPRWAWRVHLLCLYIFGGWFIISILDRNLHRLARVHSKRPFFPSSSSHLSRVFNWQILSHIVLRVFITNSNARLRQSLSFVYIRSMMLSVHFTCIVFRSIICTPQWCLVHYLLACFTVQKVLIWKSLQSFYIIAQFGVVFSFLLLSVLKNLFRFLGMVTSTFLQVGFRIVNL